MCVLGIVERPRVSWGVLGCPGVVGLTRLVGDVILNLARGKTFGLAMGHFFLSSITSKHHKRKAEGFSSLPSARGC